MPRKKIETLDPGLVELLATIGERIRSLRTSAGLNQSELADAIGLHQTYVTVLETGTQNTSVDVLYRVAKKFNQPINTLFPDGKGDLDGVNEESFRRLVGVVEKLVEVVQSRKRKDEVLVADASKLLVSINAKLEKNASLRSEISSTKSPPPKKAPPRNRK